MRSDRPVGTLILLVAALFISASPLAAQWRSEAGPWLTGSPAATAVLPPPEFQLSTPELRQMSQPASPLLLTVVGAAASLGGFYLGGVAGYEADRRHYHWEGHDSPGLVGFMGGSMIGSALATPLLVNTANGGRGSLGAAYGASALIAGAGLVALASDHSPAPGIAFLSAPLAQVVTAVLIERRTSR